LKPSSKRICLYCVKFVSRLVWTTLFYVHHTAKEAFCFEAWGENVGSHVNAKCQYQS
jgi:hypothetical protein